MSHQERSLALVLDWDGTVTERDGLHMAIERFGDLGVFDALEDELGSTLTLNEVIAAEMATIRAPLEEVRAWLVEHVRVRAGFRELVAEHDPLIVSSGFRELIEPILEREGVEVELHANRVDPSTDGWRVEWRYDSSCESCGESCKRSIVQELAGDDELVYIGDGYSDRCAAEASDKVFATRGLAEYLENRGIPYERFNDFHDVVRGLAA